MYYNVLEIQAAPEQLSGNNFSEVQSLETHHTEDSRKRAQLPLETPYEEHFKIGIPPDETDRYRYDEVSTSQRSQHSSSRVSSLSDDNMISR